MLRELEKNVFFPVIYMKITGLSNNQMMLLDMTTNRAYSIVRIREIDNFFAYKIKLI